MATHCRYDGQDAIDWANGQREADWRVWRYERSERILVIAGSQGESVGELGFTVLRGVCIVDTGIDIGSATFALQPIPPKPIILEAERFSRLETLHGMQIAGENGDGWITFHSLSVYAMSERATEKQ